MTTDGGNPRAAALRVITAVMEEGELGHRALADELSRHPSWSGSEKAFFTRLAEGTVERCLELDYVIGCFSRTPVRKMKPVIRGILRMGAYQLLYMDSVPDRAACSEAVKLAKKKGFTGLSGFVNGVMRAIADGKDGRTYPPADTPEGMSVRYSMPIWIVEKWQALYGPVVTKQILEAMLTERPLCVHMNLSRASEKEILESLQKQGIEAKPHPYSSEALVLARAGRPGGLAAFEKGWLQVQDISSQLTSSLAVCALREAAGRQAAAEGPAQGQAVSAQETAEGPACRVVLDVCAAPGGKSIYLADAAARLGQPVRVISRDLTADKIRQIEENKRRTGFEKMELQVRDARELAEEERETADVVIADLPCSGLGIMGRKKDIRYHVTPESLHSLAALQREILQTVWQYVKPGGYLIYSTCTINPEENEENARWFGSHFPFQLRDVGEWLPAGAPKTGRYLQLLPGVHDSDGFFAAVFRRTGGTG